MSAERPVVVQQKEELDDNSEAHYWFTVGGGNGETVLTSKMYTERWRAKRAARAFIESVAPAAITFRYWAGTTPAQVAAAQSQGRDGSMRNRRRATERIRHRGFVSTQIRSQPA